MVYIFTFIIFLIGFFAGYICTYTTNKCNSACSANEIGQVPSFIVDKIKSVYYKGSKKTVEYTSELPMTKVTCFTSPSDLFIVCGFLLPSRLRVFW